MTAKEKAEELILKYQSGYVINRFSYQFQNDKEDAKQCAIITVDEILSINNERMYQLTGVKENFYREVKQEIKKL
jgi:hypothetical protein